MHTAKDVLAVTISELLFNLGFLLSLSLVSGSELRMISFQFYIDAENLFTNVPIDETIEIIIKCVYENPNLKAPNIPKELLKSLLITCTKEAPFRHIDGSLYRQIDGVAMGSPLGPAFANFYMANLENNILDNGNHSLKPLLYRRYIDDILVIVNSEKDVLDLKRSLQEESVLKFTHELGYNKIAFLDVSLEIKNGEILTEVYTKSTNQGDCLNYMSECPQKYKETVIYTLINRAYKISSDWSKFQSEITRLRQMFANNNYPSLIVDEQINKFLNKKHIQIVNTTESQGQVYKLYYRNQMTSQHKIDETKIRQIMKTKVKCINQHDKLQLSIYYSNKKMTNLIMRNNLNSSRDALRRSNVVYKIKCPVEDCKLLNPYYIGSTRCTLAQRITGHVQSGSIRNHIINEHNIAMERKHLTTNAAILQQLPDKDRLHIYEALCIKTMQPSINEQDDNFQRSCKLYASEPLNELARVSLFPTPQEAILRVSLPEETHQYNTRSKNRN